MCDLDGRGQSGRSSSPSKSIVPSQKARLSLKLSTKEVFVTSFVILRVKGSHKTSAADGLHTQKYCKFLRAVDTPLLAFNIRSHRLLCYLYHDQ